jgi:hypothetical protein
LANKVGGLSHCGDEGCGWNNIFKQRIARSDSVECVDATSLVAAIWTVQILSPVWFSFRLELTGDRIRDFQRVQGSWSGSLSRSAARFCYDEDLGDKVTDFDEYVDAAVMSNSLTAARTA